MNPFGIWIENTLPCPVVLTHQAQNSQEFSSSVDEISSSSVDRNPSSSDNGNPSSSVDVNPSSSVNGNPSSSDVGNPSSSVDRNPSSSVGGNHSVLLTGTLLVLLTEPFQFCWWEPFQFCWRESFSRFFFFFFFLPKHRLIGSGHQWFVSALFQLHQLCFMLTVTDTWTDYINSAFMLPINYLWFTLIPRLCFDSTSLHYINSACMSKFYGQDKEVNPFSSLLITLPVQIAKGLFNWLASS